MGGLERTLNLGASCAERQLPGCARLLAPQAAGLACREDPSEFEVDKRGRSRQVFDSILEGPSFGDVAKHLLVTTLESMLGGRLDAPKLTELPCPKKHALYLFASGCARLFSKVSTRQTTRTGKRPTQGSILEPIPCSGGHLRVLPSDTRGGSKMSLNCLFGGRNVN